MKYLKPLFLALILGIAAWRLASGGAISRPPGQLVTDEPKQSVVELASPIQFDEFRLTPRARYEIEARVLSVERYRFDGGSSLSPIDFAVGWGVMSDSETLAHFKVRQGARFFTIYPDDEAIDIPTALRASANMHLIPADERVRSLLLSTRVGHVVTLRGYLVSADRADGFTWNTSLTREDDGAGACELMYVEAISRR